MLLPHPAFLAETNSTIQRLSLEEVHHIRTTVESASGPDAAQALKTLSRVYVDWPAEQLVAVIDLLRYCWLS